LCRQASGFGFALLCALCWLSTPGAARAADDGWEATLDRIVPAVVSLRVSTTRTFDTHRAGVSVATGFVVDAERGLILTNRHVVQSGPVTAEAIFLDHERIPVHPVYRDPVHDFGFFRFDPSQVRFMEVAEIELAPERARVGAEIRVIGNDAGEKLSILAGTLARLDRDAPAYGNDRYNDFNTFYYQAASGTSGGSSGSPVIDRSGRALALNAGGSRSSSSSFFLPLDRVVRALERIRADEPVTRGSLGAVLRHVPFDELGRLGLRPQTEAVVRRELADPTGLLVVSEVVPGRSADDRLEAGDVVLRLEGALLEGFAPLEAVLDDRVGGSVSLEIERGGVPLRIEVPVGDLHAVTPSSYLEFGGGVLHPLSYQQARNRGIRVEGVYLASAGFVFGRAGIRNGSVLREVDGIPVANLDELEAVLASRPDGARLPVRYFHISEPRAPGVGVLRVDRHWFPMQRCDRDDRVGTWACRESALAPPPDAPEAGTVEFAAEGPRAARELAASLVFVEFDVPFKIDGAQGTAFSGAGVVVDAERGLVIVDRDTVPVSLGDVELTFARSLTVPGRVVALHPEHSLAVVSYDPATIGDTAVRAVRFDVKPVEPGEELWLVGLTGRQQMVSRRTEVARVEEIPLPLPSPPRFRESNIELISVTEREATVGGVLADHRGVVRALWVSISRDDRGKPRAFFAGIPAELAIELVKPLRNGRPFRWHSLGAELAAVPLSRARDRGLGGESVRKLAAHDPVRRQALEVARVRAGEPEEGGLAVGDLLLAVDGKPVSAPRQIERAAAGRASIALTVLRAGAEVTLDAPTLELDPIGTRRALIWAGALLQAPPEAARSQRNVPSDGVYVVGRWYGSPVDRHGLRATRRIVAVDGEPTRDLDEFLAAVGDTPDRGSVRLRTVDLDGKADVRTLELDLRYWPTIELRWNGSGWVRSEPEITDAAVPAVTRGATP